MEIKVSLDGKMKVTALFEGHGVTTDQPKEDGGEGAGPAPFDLFLASLATCAGFFVQRFCQTRGIPRDGISLVQTSEWDESAHLVSKIKVEIRLPASFPEKYKAAVVAAASQCTVKKHLQTPPALEVVARTA
jgi:ribosomal protein S12 methylthiotransferase accessory factor